MIYQTETTRLKILEQAETCFSDSGFFETQMKDIAVATGMSRNTLYRYFRDKTELGLAILELTLNRKIEKLSDKINRALKDDHRLALEKISTLFREVYEEEGNETDDRFIAEFDAFYSGARIPEGFRAKVKNAINIAATGQLDDLIEAGKIDGSIRKDIDTHLMSLTLTTALHSFHQRMLLRGPALVELDENEGPELLPMLLQLLTDGMRAHK